MNTDIMLGIAYGFILGVVAVFLLALAVAGKVK